MSTELADITEAEYRQLLLERVVLVSVWTSGNEATAENSIAELKALAETAGSQVVEGLIQRRDRPDPATYIGRGKVAELRDVVSPPGRYGDLRRGVDARTAAQSRGPGRCQSHRPNSADPRHLRSAREERWRVQAQVELAQLQYLKQRLRGWGGNLTAGRRRASGGVGIGGRGPGETKLETDRRRISSRTLLRTALREMDITGRLKRAGRRRHESHRSPSPGTPTPASPACSTGSPERASSSTTHCSQPLIQPLAAPRLSTAGCTP